MNRNTSISKLLIGLFFIAVYCNVLFTQILCSYSQLSEFAETEHHHHDELRQPSKHGHENSHKHNNSKDDDCCKDETSSFFASQINSSNISFDFKNTFFTSIIGIANNIFINNLPSINPKGYFAYKLPPPKIPDIRIYIHSFTI